MKIVIVGAGLGGLSAAITLARAGHTVTVFEKNSTPGGKVSEIHANGYRFDCGPSLLTLPSVLKNLLGKECRALTVLKLRDSCSNFWVDGTNVISRTRVLDFAHELASKLFEQKRSYIRYHAIAKKIFDSVAKLFLTRSMHHASRYKSKLFWGALVKIPIILLCKRLHALHAQYFNNRKTQQIFDRFATYVGSSPFKISAIYCLISYIENGMGAFAISNGMQEIPMALSTVAQKLGVRFNYTAEITAIKQARSLKGVVAVRANSVDYPCDSVIFNTDIEQAQRLLGIKTNKMNVSTKRSSSAVVFLWGVSKKARNFNIHNVIYSENYRQEFDDIYRRGVAPSDPTIYIHISSKITPTDAPPNKENWFVMINTPANSAIDWGKVVPDLRWKAIQKINHIIDTDIAKYIEFEKIITPLDFSKKYCDTFGSLYGTNAHGIFGAMNRHSNYSRKFNNVFYCGGTVHPGGGIPLVLLSGQIAATLCDPQNISFPTLEFEEAP